MDARHELRTAVRFRAQRTIDDGEFASHGERAAKHGLARLLRNVDEAAGSDDRRLHLADVHVSRLVHFSEAEEGHVDAASVIKGELLRRLDDGRAVVCGAEFEALGGDAADLALLDGWNHLVREALFASDLHDTVRDAESEVQRGA